MMKVANVLFLFALSFRIALTMQASLPESPSRDGRKDLNNVYQQKPRPRFYHLDNENDQAGPSSGRRPSPFPHLKDVGKYTLKELMSMRPIRPNIPEQLEFKELFANHPKIKELKTYLQDPKKVIIGDFAEKVILIQGDWMTERNNYSNSRKFNTALKDYLLKSGLSLENVQAIQGYTHKHYRTIHSARVRENESEQKQEKRRKDSIAGVLKWKAKRETEGPPLPLSQFLRRVDQNNRPSAVQVEHDCRRFRSLYRSETSYNKAVTDYLESNHYNSKDARAATGRRLMIVRRERTKKAFQECIERKKAHTEQTTKDAHLGWPSPPLGIGQMTPSQQSGYQKELVANYLRTCRMNLDNMHQNAEFNPDQPTLVHDSLPATFHGRWYNSPTRPMMYDHYIDQDWWHPRHF